MSTEQTTDGWYTWSNLDKRPGAPAGAVAAGKVMVRCRSGEEFVARTADCDWRTDMRDHDIVAWKVYSPGAQARAIDRATAHQEGGSHYKDCAIQPVEYIFANNLGFAEGNVVKYVTRWKSKGGVGDLKKARHYLDLLIESIENPKEDATS